MVSFRAGFAQAVPFPHWRFEWCRVLHLVALLLALLTPLPGCSAREEPSRPRVLLVGIDGASYSLARSLQEQGALPNLARLAEAGVFAPLRSIPPFLSPRIWNSIATGKTPEKHGIGSFAWPDAKNRNHLFLSSDRKSHALWNIASESGLTVGVVNWWTTYPPEKINGVMVSDHALWSPHMRQPDVMTTSPSSTTGLVFPISWEERALALLKSELPLTAFPNPFAAPAESFPPGIDLDALRRDFEVDAAVVRTALEIEAELHPDVMLVYLAGIDHASHWLWGTLESPERYSDELRPAAEQIETGARALRRFYSYTDALIGLLIERYGGEDLIMVVSDHGFHRSPADSVRTGTHWKAAARDGVIFARGHGVVGDAPDRVSTVLDVTPSILAWLHLPIARDMDGRPMSFLDVQPVEPVDTYDTTPVERLHQLPSSSETEMLRQLHMLGYFE